VSPSGRPAQFGRIYPPDEAWLARQPPEPILEPELPIIDTHHHLWDRGGHRYFLPEFLADAATGHHVVASVFLECHSMYRAAGPEPMRPVGETEFVAGQAAMSASGQYGPTRVAAGIVGFADLTLGDRVEPVLEAHLRAGGGRFRGVRHSAAWDASDVIGNSAVADGPHVYRRPDFRAGLAVLTRLGLSLDAWVFHPQLADVVDLARAFPDTTIVLDHVGTPIGRGSYAGKLDERFGVWRENIRELAKSPNVVVKLGGLAMAFCNFPSFLAEPRVPSEQLAREWGPYIETCIEAFGPERCMFESNFPVDMGSCSYATLWNAFKRIASGASAAEKAALFHNTAARVYRVGAADRAETAGG
jgi:predicted TIM-barrel fold metal-dependent hydrolase